MKELVVIISVIPVKAVLGTYPYKTGLILTDSMETVIRQLTYRETVCFCAFALIRNNPASKTIIGLRIKMIVVRFSCKYNPLFPNVPYHEYVLEQTAFLRTFGKPN